MPKRISRSAPEDYFELIRRFPLKKIQTAAEHARALDVSGRLIGSGRRLTAGEGQYLDALVIMIREFEHAHDAPKLPRTSGIEVLKHLMEQHGITQKELARLLGIGESAASMILAGSRDLTKSHIEKLSIYFGVGVSAFFGSRQVRAA